MNHRWSAIFKSALVIAVLLPQAGFAQLKLLTSGGFSATLQELLPQFEKTTGITVTALRGRSQGSGPDTIGAQLRRGVSVDLVIMSREGLDDLIRESRIVAGSDTDLAQTILGVAVRAGAPKPDISTVEAFKKMVLQAKSVTLPSTTGIYVRTKLFPRLGIAEQVSGKLTDTGVAAVVSGQAEVAVQPMSELLHVEGVDFVGTIPREIQYVSVFTAALVKGGAQPESSRRLIAYLASKEAAPALKNNGMEPPRSPRLR